MPTASKDLCGGGRGPSAARFAHKSSAGGVEAAVWNRAWPRWCRSHPHGGSAVGRAAAAALGVALAGNRAGEAASAATVDPRAALIGMRRHGGGAAARGGDVVGEVSREGEGRRLSPAPGAAVKGARHFSPAGAARARNGREAEISGGYGRAGRPRVSVKNQTKLTEIF